MKFHLIEKANPRDLQASKKWYANPINDGKITEDHLAKKIAGRSSLTTGDVSSVIKNLLDEMPEYLLMGRSVNLSSFGTFRLSFGSEGVENKDEFNTHMINHVKVIFTPNTTFKRMLEEISFERVE